MRSPRTTVLSGRCSDAMTPRPREALRRDQSSSRRATTAAAALRIPRWRRSAASGRLSGPASAGASNRSSSPTSQKNRERSSSPSIARSRTASVGALTFAARGPSGTPREQSRRPCPGRQRQTGVRAQAYGRPQCCPRAGPATGSVRPRRPGSRVAPLRLPRWRKHARPKAPWARAACPVPRCHRVRRRAVLVREARSLPRSQVLSRRPKRPPRGSCGEREAALFGTARRPAGSGSQAPAGVLLGDGSKAECRPSRELHKSV